MVAHSSRSTTVWYFVIGALLLALLIVFALNNEKKPAPATMGAAPPATGQADRATAAVVGSPATDFTLQDAAGNNVHLGAFRGKVLLVDFWATWCQPCRHEIPGFIQLQQQYAAKGLQVIGVSLDEKGWEAVKPFIRQEGINYPVVLGNENLVQQYGGFDGIPTTFLIDKRGDVVKEFSGFHPPEEFEKEIAKLL